MFSEIQFFLSGNIKHPGLKPLPPVTEHRPGKFSRFRARFLLKKQPLAEKIQVILALNSITRDTAKLVPSSWFR